MSAGETPTACPPDAPDCSGAQVSEQVSRPSSAPDPGPHPNPDPDPDPDPGWTRPSTPRQGQGKRQRRSTFRRLVRSGWVPDQHGAWPMATVPIVVGALDSQLRWQHLLFLLAWVSAFLMFHVATLWIAAPRRARYSRALLCWVVCTLLLGFGLLALSPALSWWAPLFAPLVGVAVFEAAHRRTRSLTSRVSTVLASSLTCAVAHDLGWGTVQGTGWWPWWDAGTSAPDTGWTHAWIVTGLLACYFLGTVPHVRALIRGRRDRAWVIGSLVWHLLTLVAAVTAAATNAVSWWVVIVWVILLLRAVLIPLDQRRRGAWRPLPIGLVEMLTCLLVAIALVLPA